LFFAAEEMYIPGMGEEQEEQQARIDRLVLDTNLALNGLPIVERLEFVAEMILLSGGVKHSIGTVPSLVLAHQALDNVIKVLRKHPKAAQLRGAVP
jgi:hypothetical protein